MTAYSLFPSFVQVYYHSIWSPHVMTLPTRAWLSGADQGEFLGWDDLYHDANDMITALITEWMTLFTEEVVFDFYTIFNYDSEESLPVSVASGVLGLDSGVAAGTISNKAVQITVTWQCLGGFILKTVGLDANPPTDFEKLNPVQVSAGIPGVVDEITALTNGWASRAGTRPLFPKQAAYTLNEKLRRAYHLN